MKSPKVSKMTSHYMKQTREADTHEISILIPEDLQVGDTIHIITEITSDDPIPLKRYARTILTVTTIKEDHA